MMTGRTKISVQLLAVLMLMLMLFTGCGSKSKKALRQLELGQKYLTEQNYTEAAASFTEVIQLAPENIPAYLGRAEAYVGLEQYDDARADYTTVIEKTEERPYTQAQAYVGRAEVNERTDQNEEAMADYKAASAVLGRAVAEKTDLPAQELEKLKARAEDACARLTAMFEQNDVLEEEPGDETNGPEEQQPDNTDAQEEQPAASQGTAGQQPAETLKMGQSVDLGGVTVKLANVTYGVYDGPNILAVDFEIHNGSGASIWHGHRLSANGDTLMEWVGPGFEKKTEFKATCDGKTIRNAQDGRYYYSTPEMIANDDWGELGFDDLLPDGVDSDIYVYAELPDSGWERMVLTYTPSYAGGKSASFVVTPGDITEN